MSGFDPGDGTRLAGNAAGSPSAYKIVAPVLIGTSPVLIGTWRIDMHITVRTGPSRRWLCITPVFTPPRTQLLETYPGVLQQ